MSITTHQFDWGAIKLRLRECEAAIDRGWAPSEQQRTAIYRQRVLDCARRTTPARDRTKARSLLVFSLGEERFGIDLAALLKVFPLPKLTPVPTASQAVLGVINVAGEIRNVFDAARLLGFPETENRGPGHVALLRNGETETALRVDRVEAIESVCIESLVRADQTDAAVAMPCVEGITSDRLIVLNVQRLLSQLNHTVDFSKFEED